MTMPELGERFESLSRTRTPDLWPDIEGREPRRPIEPSSARRLVVAVAAFVVAIAGIGLAAVTFGGSRPPVVSGKSGTAETANGPIYFRVGGADSGSRIESIEADGTGRRTVFPEDSPVHYDRLSFSPDGMRIAFDDFLEGEYGIETADPDGSDIVRLTNGVNDSWASWSPDGTMILFSSTRYDPSIEQCLPGFPHEHGCPTDIYRMDVDGSNVVRLTDDAASEYQPVWSPDGERIAFARSLGDPQLSHPAIFTMDPDGTDVRQISSADGGSDFWPSWSPDGSQIVFAAIRKEDWGIWAVDADGSNEHLILGGTGAGYVDNPVWSPDGTLIAFVGNLTIDDYSPEDALYVMHPDGTDVTPIADAPSVGVAGDLAWQPISAPALTTEPTPSIPPPSAEVVDTFMVGRDVRSVAYGEGSVWVAASNNDGTLGGRIIRIDPQTHEVQAEIPVEVIPTWEVGGGAMVFEDEDLWVVGDLERQGVFDDPGGGADAAVIRIDASTNEVVQTISVGGAGGADLAFLDGELWVLLFGDESVGNTMEVVRMNPATGAVAARVPLETSWAHTILAANDHLVVYEGGEGATNVGGHLASIDPATNAVDIRAEIPTRYFEGGPVAWQGQVWFAAESGLARFDPVAGTVSEGVVELDPTRFAFCCGFVEADDRGIWFVGFDGKTGSDEPHLDLFDPARGDVIELATLDEGTPVAMAVAPNSVWILNYEGSLTHVSLG
jgi:dipeptidyl aminopeptidase/acylaminoacyl peptidase